MSDYSDFCRETREHKRQQRDKFRYGGGMAEQISIAEKISVNFQWFSTEHMRITIKTDRGLRDIDFWPSTTKWKALKGKASGYGVKKIVKHFKLKDEK